MTTDLGAGEQSTGITTTVAAAGRVDNAITRDSAGPVVLRLRERRSLANLQWYITHVRCDGVGAQVRDARYWPIDAPDPGSAAVPDRTALYPGLGDRGPRARARWVVSGHGELTVSWAAARAGHGSVGGEV